VRAARLVPLIALALLPDARGGGGIVDVVEEAAAASGVPSRLLYSIAYAETRMVRTAFSDGTTDWVRPRPDPDGGGDVRSLGGLAQWLALAGRQAGLTPRSPLGAWMPLLAHLNDSGTRAVDWLYADDVLGAAADGFVVDDEAGERIALPPLGDAIVEAPPIARPPELAGAPFALWAPAGGAGQRAPRTAPRHVRYIVIHTMESTLPIVVSYFAAPTTKVAAHYLVRARDGLTVQMVDERQVGFHDACFNEESIGIEHEGWVAHGARWYGDAMYRASARLVRDIAARHQIPLDRAHILGHGEAPDCSDHVDPGADWDWTRFMAYVNEGASGAEQAAR
jgi:hypothetical protein